MPSLLFSHLRPLILRRNSTRYLLLLPQEAACSLQEKITSQTSTSSLRSLVSASIAVRSERLIPDTVTRPQFYKYFYPQEAFVQDGVINRSILEACDKKLSLMGNREQFPPVPFSPLKLSAQEHKDQRNLALLYPYGATLTIQRPAACIMSSGSCTYPFNQPLGAICAKNGRICVFGSHLMFSEEYVNKEDNRKLLDVLLKWLTGQLALTVMEADEPDLTNYHFTPSIEKLARMPRGCLEEPDALPEDIDLQFRLDTLKLDGRLIGDVIGLYDELGMKREALKLIQPKFETPLPPLQLAVFPPEIKGSNPPQLELFDFDQEFASEKTRLAQLANRCTDEDLGFFIQECGRTLGIKGSSPKSILEYAVTRLVQWKLSPQ